MTQFCALKSLFLHDNVRMFFLLLVQFPEHLRITGSPPFEVMFVAAKMRDLLYPDPMLKRAVTNHTSPADIEFR